VRIRIACTTLILASLALASTVRAGGFDYPDHGTAGLIRSGAFVARADDPSAVFYNPAGAARLQGTHIFLGGNLLMEDIRYQRRIYPVYGADKNLSVPLDRYPHDPDLRMPEVQNNAPPFLTPFLGVSTDLGFLAPYNLRLLAGFYGPHVQPSHSFPRYCEKGTDPCVPTDDAQNGIPSPARYDAVYTYEIVIYPSLGLAWQPFKWLRIGAVFQATYANFTFNSVLSAMAFKEMDGQPSENPAQDVDIEADVEDPFTPTAIIGVHLSPLSFLEAGASVRIGYEFNFEGTVTADSTSGMHSLVKPNPTTINIDLHMPWVVRGGVRYINRDAGGRERFDVELDFVYESTGQLDRYDISTGGHILGKPIQGLDQVHNWTDTYSLRLGGTYFLRDLFKDATLAISAGAFWESEAVPEEYTRLDFLPFERGGLSVGVTLHWRRYSLAVGYMHTFYATRDVKPDGGDARTGTCAQTKGAEGCGSKIPLMTPMDSSYGGPIGNGVYQMSTDIVTIGASVQFGG